MEKTRNGSVVGDTPAPAAWTVDQFCKRHRICRATFYNMLRRGEGPRRYKVGSRTLISVEAERDWQLDQERRAAEVA